MSLANNRRFIVTGGAGMIGSALVWALNNQGVDNILIVDRLGSDEKWKNLVPLHYADFMDADEFYETFTKRGDVFGQLGAIFHMGACASTLETDAAYLMKNNYEYSRDFARWALTRKHRFVYATSAATYGDGTHGMSDQVRDLSPYRPLNMYAYSKHLFEYHAIQQGIDRSMLGVKFFNIYGPNEHHKGEMRSVVHKAFHQIQKTGKMTLYKSDHPQYENGKQMRDFLYVKDAVEMVIHLAMKPLTGGIYNIGSGKARTWTDLAHAIFAALGQPLGINFVDMPDQLRGSYQNYTQADLTKFHETQYPHEIMSLEEGVFDYVRNYLLPGRYLGDEPWDEDEITP